MLSEALDAASIDARRADRDVRRWTRTRVTQELGRQEEEPRTERGRAKRVFWRAVLGTNKMLIRAAADRPARPAPRQAPGAAVRRPDHEPRVLDRRADRAQGSRRVHLRALRQRQHPVGGHGARARPAAAGAGRPGRVRRCCTTWASSPVPGDVLRKPAKLDAEEWRLMRRHPIEGVKMMLRMPGLSKLQLDSMRVCLEHHMNYDRTGYPSVGIVGSQSTLSRIVAMADCFDAMTAHRAYHQPPVHAVRGAATPGRPLAQLVRSRRAVVAGAHGGPVPAGHGDGDVHSGRWCCR